MHYVDARVAVAEEELGVVRGEVHEFDRLGGDEFVGLEVLFEVEDSDAEVGVVGDEEFVGVAEFYEGDAS